MANAFFNSCKLTDEQFIRLLLLVVEGVIVVFGNLNEGASCTYVGREVLSDEQQFYQDMRTAIRELDEEELQQKQQVWQAWFDSYIVEGLY